MNLHFPASAFPCFCLLIQYIAWGKVYQNPGESPITDAIVAARCDQGAELLFTL
jgi:hypothetical protein